MHRHKWTTTRVTRVGNPLVRHCAGCGEYQRWQRGWWVVTVPGKQ